MAWPAHGTRLAAPGPARAGRPSRKWSRMSSMDRGREHPRSGGAGTDAVGDPDGKKWVLGVDLGGTNIVVGALPMSGGDGEVLGLRSVPTEAHRGAKYVVDRIVSLIQECRADVASSNGGSPEDFAGVGIGSPGPLDRDTGTVINTPNLGWRNFPLRDLIA